MEIGAEAMGLNSTLDEAKIQTLSTGCVYLGSRKKRNEELRATEERPRTPIVTPR